MIIECISDLHGHYPKLEGGDLLIIAGDLTARDLPEERVLFLEWLAEQKYRKKVFIAGNHDKSLEGLSIRKIRDDGCDYLCDSGTEVQGLKIWGTPWSLSFKGINPRCKAFTVNTEKELAEKWALIPDDVDILITHSPPFKIKDRTLDGRHVGSDQLKMKSYRSKAILHVFGHIHESYGIVTADIKTSPKQKLKRCIFVNASHVNEHYEPVNKPVRIEL